MKFPRDVPKRKVIKTLETPGFKLFRVGKHISMVRESPDGTKTPLLYQIYGRIKGPTLRTICRQAGIKREEFLRAYEKA